jgi:isoamylase
MSLSGSLLTGTSFPLGATPREGGTNFCIYAKGATAVELLLFNAPDSTYPEQVIVLDPKHHKTFHYWHVFVPGIATGQVYGYRVDGPFVPAKGLRFDASKVLIDPYARSVVGWPHYQRKAAIEAGDNAPYALRSVVVDLTTYDWQDDLPLHRPYCETVIYELHVGGFTQHPSSGLAPELRGTYAGLVEKIPYLQALGVTAVELMPIHQFDAADAPLGRENYWGYSTLAFFAPHRQYSSDTSPLGPVNEFRDMVKALHHAGIEVILDVVFNHSAEGDHTGPTLSFRGLSNKDYYILDGQKAYYKNYSGCGNTLKMSAISSHLILDCLRYWVSEMHVDGFRFDLASVLSRNVRGEPSADPPLLWLINSDPVLAGTKIIAEAWDAAGLYQVGSFAGDRFAEWNGPYRDDIRRFLRGDTGMVRRLADRILGSPDIYAAMGAETGWETNYSIHFVTCHDGFTLQDLVSYDQKHNQANGEDNRDGTDANWSWNCGTEGPTDALNVRQLRSQQVRNFLTLWAMSQGTPMLLMGDEVLRTQKGNNNAYCQNNDLSWFNWEQIEQNQDMLRFTQGLIDLIQSFHCFKHDQPLVVTRQAIAEPAICWHGIGLDQPDWSDNSHSLAFTLRYLHYQECFHVMLNAYWQPLTFELPSLPARSDWYRIVDTAQSAPADFCPPEQAQIVPSDTYEVCDLSCVVLLAKPHPS